MLYLENELYHHGIKGQQWGIRRYQNPDGSYTEEGRKRYGIDAHGHASVAGTGRYFKDKYSGMSVGAAKVAYKKESKAFEKDYRKQMHDRKKTKESREDVVKRLREKYGTIEYDSFIKSRDSRANIGKIKIAAIATAAVATLGTAGFIASKAINGSNNPHDNTNTGYGKYMGKGMYSENTGNRQKSTVEEFQERLKRERQRAANEQSRRNWAEQRQAYEQRERAEKERKKQEKQEWLKDQAERIRRERIEREKNRKENDRYWYERIHDL